ncbi:MAG TPA: hypothetical protein VLM38_22565 [Blastocatellia bacterium]|nr:hypothetical protein [Blastocatellia bacterium]
MYNPGSCLRSGRFLLLPLLVLCLVSPLTNADSYSSQKEAVDKKERPEKIVRAEGSTLKISEYHPIPEATERCTPEEAEWWQRVRNAGNELQKKSSEKSIKNFYLLLLEGLQKAYRVPLKDRGPQMLVVNHPPQTDVVPKFQINATLVLSIEYLADASIGDIQIIEKVGHGLDESTILAKRRDVFLPAIKDGAFVTDRLEVRIKFSTRR